MRYPAVLAATAAALLGASSAAYAEFGVVATYGSKGTGDGKFQSTGGLALDAAGNMYVGDWGERRVEKLTPEGAFAGSIAAGQLAWFGGGNCDLESGECSSIPTADVKVGPDGNLYVVNTPFATSGTGSRPEDNRVMVFDLAGNFLRQIGNGRGPGDGNLHKPIGVAIAPGSGNVYVSDGFSRIQIFSSAGTFIAKFGEGQIAPGGADGLALDAAGNLYVANTGHHRISKFTAGGQYINGWGAFGTADGEFRSPNGIAVDRDGNVWVADVGNHRVQKFSPDGQFLMKFGSFGNAKGQFGGPEKVATDPAGNVYVSDTRNGRVVKLGEVPAAAPSTVSGTVFSDSNGNGARDAGEPGLGDWVVYVDYNGNGARGADEPAARTNGTGAYTLGGVVAGTFKVREELQAGFACTAPSSCAKDVQFGGAAQTVDFGNLRAAATAPAGGGPGGGGGGSNQLTVAIPKGQDLFKARGLSLLAYCPVKCSFVVIGTAVIGGKSMAAGKLRRNVKAGKPTRLKLPLGKRVRNRVVSALRRKKKVKLKVSMIISTDTQVFTRKFEVPLLLKRNR